MEGTSLTNVPTTAVACDLLKNPSFAIEKKCLSVNAVQLIALLGFHGFHDFRTSIAVDAKLREAFALLWHPG